MAVVAFYTALHLAERLRALTGHGHSENHKKRDEYVRSHHLAIYRQYHILQNASEIARYWSRAEFFDHF